MEGGGGWAFDTTLNSRERKKTPVWIGLSYVAKKQKKLKHRLVELLAKADDYLEITQIIHAIKLT